MCVVDEYERVGVVLIIIIMKPVTIYYQPITLTTKQVAIHGMDNIIIR